uniref:Uncharacterized protein n=1 Tax=Jaculus jaculus TaxID=51337 RepID=A0A8C5LGV4_JACJA
MDSSSFIQFDVPDQLNELRLQGKLCDIVVHIQGQPFRAHKAVLDASSPYFQDHSALSTMSGLSISVIKNPNVFEQLLSFCYTGRMSLQLKDVVSFLTAASFLQRQCVIDKGTQILESILSKISVGDADSVTAAAEETPESRNGVKDGGFFANPIESSPPHCPPVRQPTASSDLRMEQSSASRLQGEGHSDRGSSGRVSEYESQIEGDHEQGDLLLRESEDGPRCSDSPSPGDDGYHAAMVAGGCGASCAVNAGSCGSALRHAGASDAFGSLSNSSPPRPMLSCFRAGRARQKRALSVHRHSDLQSAMQGSDGEARMNNPGCEPVPGEGRKGSPVPVQREVDSIHCGKSFGQKGSLDRHTRLHMGTTPFVRKFCGKKDAHDEPFRCEICGKCLPFQGTLNQHPRKNHPGVAEVRSRMEPPERTDVYMEQKLEHEASASEMALDSRMEIHTVSDPPD